MDEDFNPNVIIVIIAMVVGGIRWLASAASKKYKRKGGGDPSLDEAYERARRKILERQRRQISEAETERVRRGQRPGAPAATPPPIPSAPPAWEKPPARKPPPAPARQKPKPRKPVLSAEEEAALARFQDQQAHAFDERSARRPARSRSRVRELLASPAAARDAVVLAEILRRPKGV